MNKDILRAIRDATMQTPSDNLLDATRAIQDSLQALYPLQNPFETAFGEAASVGTAESQPTTGDLEAKMGSVSEEVGDRVGGQPGPGHAEKAVMKPTAGPYEQFVSGKFTQADTTLDYRLYIPPLSANNGSLLVMLHGCAQGATDFSVGTAMNTLARAEGYTVLYPDQSSAANPNSCWNWFLPAHQHRSAGEPAFLASLTQSICHEQGLNLSRVFVAGLSAGGAMALILAEEFPEIFAAVGVHSGLATGLANSSAQALRAMSVGGEPAPCNSATVQRPILVIHGEQDRVVHPQNAAVIVQRCLERYRQQHSGEKPVYRCSEEAIGVHPAQRHEYRNPDGEVVCRYLQLDSISHAWSGGDARGSFTAAGGVSASEALLNFFKECPDLPV